MKHESVEYRIDSWRLKRRQCQDTVWNMSRRYFITSFVSEDNDSTNTAVKKTKIFYQIQKKGKRINHSLFVYDVKHLRKIVSN